MWFFQSAIDAALKMARRCGACGTKMFAKAYQNDSDMACPRCRKTVPPKYKKGQRKRGQVDYRD